MKKPFKHKEIIVDGEIRYTVTKNHLPYAPFEEFLKHQYIKSLYRSDGENTAKAYARNLAEFGNFLHENGYDWWDVHPGIVSSYVEWVKRGGPKGGNVVNINRGRNDSAYSASSLNQRTGAIISCFEYHQAKGKFRGIDLRSYKYSLPHSDSYKAEYNQIKTKKQSRGKNPWTRTKTKKRPPILEPDEVEFLVSLCNSLRDKLLITIMYDVGLRIGETLGLRIADIDPIEGTIRVVSRTNDNKAKVKNSAERDNLKLSKKGMALFTQYLLEEYPEEIDSDYLFVVLRDCETRGDALSYQNAYKMLVRKRKKFAKEFGHEKPFSPHWFRHSAGTDSMEHDTTGGRATQEMLGHKDIQTTTGIYVHPRKESAKERMEQIHETRKESAEKRKQRREGDDK